MHPKESIHAAIADRPCLRRPAPRRALHVAGTGPRQQSAHRSRRRRAIAATQGARLAPRHPPASGTRQPRDAHRETRRRPSARTRSRAEHRHRHHRRHRRAQGRQARAADRAARRHGCAAGDRARRSAVRIEGHLDLPRRDRRRDARLRPRRAHRDPDGRRRSPGRDAGRIAGRSAVRVPARRGRSARRRGRRRRRDAGAGHLSRLQAGSRVRPARVQHAQRRPDRRAQRADDGGVGPLQHRRQRPPDARLAALGRRSIRSSPRRT